MAVGPVPGGPRRERPPLPIARTRAHARRELLEGAQLSLGRRLQVHLASGQSTRDRRLRQPLGWLRSPDDGARERLSARGGTLRRRTRCWQARHAVHVVHTEAVDVVGRAVLVGGAVGCTESRTPMRLRARRPWERFALTCWAGVVIANDLGVGDDAAGASAGMARAAVFLGLTDVDPAQLNDDTSEVHVSVPTDFQNELDAQCRHILDERRDKWRSSRGYWTSGLCSAALRYTASSARSSSGATRRALARWETIRFESDTRLTRHRDASIHQ